MRVLAAGVGRVDRGCGTVQTVGVGAPSQRIATVPVVAAYLNVFGFHTESTPGLPIGDALASEMDAEPLGDLLGP